MTLRPWLAGAAAMALCGLPHAPAHAKELAFSVMESGTYNKAAESLAPGFEKANGATLKVVAFPWAVLRQNNTTALISGSNQFQVMSGGYYLADVYSYFRPLTEFIQRDKYAIGMIPGLMDPGRSEWFNGQQVGIPYGVDAYGLLVNNAILAKAGVQPGFATWEDVLTACGKIEAAEPAIPCLAHSTGNPEQIGAFFFSAYDGSFVDKDGHYALQADKATKAAALLPQLWKYLPKNGAAMSFDEAGALFRDGKVAMLVDWPSFVANSLDAPASAVKGGWQQVAFPGPGFPWLSLWQLFVPKTAPDPALAWAWIKTFAGPENARDNYVKYNIDPVWLAVYDDPQLKAAHAHQWPAMVAGFSRAKNPPLSGEAQDFLTNTLQDVANGRIEPATGIARVNKTWQSIPVPAALLQSAKASGLATP
jgi:ABC-type glycerol-3-phosphate transport system substrate-binding protein